MPEQKPSLPSYYTQTLGNLENLKTVALLHPRLALVGVASELEILFRAIVPVEVLAEWTADVARRKPGHPFPETVAIREQLFDVSRRPVYSANIRTLSKLLRRADECRHKRIEVNYPQVEQAIETAVEFLKRLHQLRRQGIVECEEHGRLAFL